MGTFSKQGRAKNQMRQERIKGEREMEGGREGGREEK